MEKPSELSTQLARERSEQAAERTLMAWTRTSLAAIGFGFSIEKVFRLLKNVDPNQPRHLNDREHIFGASFVALGTLTLVVASLQHLHTLRMIRQQKFLYSQPWPLTEVVAAAVVLIGIFSLWAIL